MSGTYSAPTLTVPVGPDDWLLGALDAPAIFVEYGDFECPHCAAAEPMLHELRQQLGEDLCFVFRHFPLTSSHPNAELAAEAAEAAGAQNNFWPMHDVLFANQIALLPDDLVRYAADLGLDSRRLASELTEHRYEPEIRADFMSGVRSGVSGTPTFFINDASYDGAYDLDSLLRATRKAVRLGR